MAIDPKKLNDQFNIIAGLRGFLQFEPFRLFAALANAMPNNPLAVLEIGVFCGRSLAGLACAFPTSSIVGVDPMFSDFLNSPAVSGEAEFLAENAGDLSPTDRVNALNRVLGRLEADFGTPFRDRVQLHRVTQEEFLAKESAVQLFKFCHIDGEHTFLAVRNLLDSLPRLVGPDSVIVFDDFHNEGFPDISEAVFTHASHKTSLFPLLFGLNKGVYVFEPNDRGRYAHDVAEYFPNTAYNVRWLPDGSFTIAPRPLAVPKRSFTRRVLRRIAQRFI